MIFVRPGASLYSETLPPLLRLTPTTPPAVHTGRRCRPVLDAIAAYRSPAVPGRAWSPPGGSLTVEATRPAAVRAGLAGSTAAVTGDGGRALPTAEHARDQPDE